MASKSEYDGSVERLNSATVAAIALVAVLLIVLSPQLLAQINGTPASVTTGNSAGHFNSTPGAPASVTSMGPGVPASVTSMGPNGFQTRNQFFAPLPSRNPNPPFQFQRHHGHHQNSFFPGGQVYVPYPVVDEFDAGAANPQGQDEDDYRGGPTIFDRRGSGQGARPYLPPYERRASQAQPEMESAAASQPAETPVADQPQTVLVFRDGHQEQVQNYAVVGDVLYDLTPLHHRKIAIADLDLKATSKQNDDLGIGFQLPAASETNK